MGVTSLAEAVAGVPEGAVVYLGNFGAQLFAVGHELVRQRRTGLHVVAPSGGILLDQLLAEGVVGAATISHCWNPIGPARTEHFQLAAQEGRLELAELSFGALCSALHAAAQDAPFAVTTDLRGTDYAERSAGMLATASTPFGEASIVRALAPDIAFLHVDRATPGGDGWLEQPTGDVLLAAQAARRTVLVAEELVGAGDGNPVVPGLLVDAVVECVGAVAPDGAGSRYPRDLAAYAAWTAGAGTADGRAAWRARLAASHG